MLIFNLNLYMNKSNQEHPKNKKSSCGYKTATVFS